MNKMNFRVITCLIVLCVLILSATAHGQPYTEARDPLRGVTYFSVQVSTDQLVNIQLEGGRFSDSDEMTLGLSAFFFDELNAVTDFVMWLRHDGPRKWFTGYEPEPVTITIDKQDIELIPLHILRPQPSPHDGQFIEKIEVSLSPELFREMIESSSVTIGLRTFQGLVSKRLTDDEIQILNEFQNRIMQKGQSR